MCVQIHVMECVWRSEDNFVKSISLSTFMWVLGIELRFSGLPDKHWANSLAPGPHILKYWTLFTILQFIVYACLS